MFFNRSLEKREDVNVNDWSSVYGSANGYEGAFEDSLKESTYFSCLKNISEGIAKCKLQVKKETDKGEIIDNKHYLYNLLSLRPNDCISAIDCIKNFVLIAKHEGIAGLYINRDIRGNIIGLYPVKLYGCTIDNAGIIKNIKNNKVLWDYSCFGEQGSCFDKDIIILRDFMLDKLKSTSVKSVLRESLDTSIMSQNYLNKLFQNGLTSKLMVQMSSDITDRGEIKKLQKKFDNIYNSSKSVFTMPVGYQVSPLTLKLADAQFEQLRRLSREEIAGCMGVPLSKLGIVKENAKSQEIDDLKFYNDTLLFIFEQIEQEMDWKLLTDTERKAGYKIRFNVNVLLRTDAETQANVISTYVKNGVYSLNKAKEILGIEKLDNDVTTFPSGQVTLEQLINGNVSYANKIDSKGGETKDGE